MHTIAMGGLGGHALPENLDVMRLLLRPFLGQCDASRSPDDRVSISDHLLILQAISFTDEVCKTNCACSYGINLLYCGLIPRLFSLGMRLVIAGYTFAPSL